MGNAVRAVLFDLDNTLANREEAFSRWAHWFARVQLNCSDVAELATSVSTLIALDADGYTPRDALFRTLKAHYPSLLDDVDVLVEHYRRQLVAHLPPLDSGAATLLAALDQASVPWGIVTNGSSLNQRGKIAKLDLERRAHCVVISHEVGFRKPDPAIFRLAAERLAVAEHEILFVGDHSELDAVGAAGVGMQTAWLRRARAWPDQLSPHCPDFVIDSLGELGWVAGKDQGRAIYAADLGSS
jgi:putative hydrolase of the HAD superfamily